MSEKLVTNTGARFAIAACWVGTAAFFLELYTLAGISVVAIGVGILWGLGSAKP